MKETQNDPYVTFDVIFLSYS